MANQTLLLNVSDEMKSDDERLKFDGPERGEELCSSSEPDTCGDGSSVGQQIIR